MKDRLLAGGAMMLLAYLLIFQALLVGTMHGAMAANAADPLHVICVADGVEAAPANTEGNQKAAPLCPCAALCQAAAAGGMAVAGAIPVVAYLAPLPESFPSSVANVVVVPACRGIIAEARAPPLLT